MLLEALPAVVAAVAADAACALALPPLATEARRPSRRGVAQMLRTE